MLSEKARKQLQMFLNTLEKETGYKPEHVQLYAHRGDQKTAEEFHALGFELNNLQTSTWVEYDENLNDSLQFRAVYFYAPEEQRELCHHCQVELTAENTCSHLMDETCLQCYDELAAEKRQQLTEYRNSVI